VELSHILQWSCTNKLKLNTLKTKEIVFHRPRLPNRTLPPLFPGIERVSSVKIFGVVFTSTFSPEQHINNFIAICKQRLYLLSQFKHQNLSDQALDVIFHALIMSKITYALPAFAGHISTAERNWINKFFRKANRRHLVTQIFDIDTLIETTDSRLCRSITYPDHFTLPIYTLPFLKTRSSIDAFLTLYDYSSGSSLLSRTSTLHCI